MSFGIAIYLPFCTKKKKRNQLQWWWTASLPVMPVSSGVLILFVCSQVYREICCSMTIRLALTGTVDPRRSPYISNEKPWQEIPPWKRLDVTIAGPRKRWRPEAGSRTTGWILFVFWLLRTRFRHQPAKDCSSRLETGLRNNSLLVDDTGDVLTWRTHLSCSGRPSPYDSCFISLYDSVVQRDGVPVLKCKMSCTGYSSWSTEFNCRRSKGLDVPRQGVSMFNGHWWLRAQG